MDDAMLRMLMTLSGLKNGGMVRGGSSDSDSDSEDMDIIRRMMGPRPAGKYHGGDDDILVLKISIKGSKPPIWRRIEVNANTSFYEMHGIIQGIMPWRGCHMHNFHICGKLGRGMTYFQSHDDGGFNTLGEDEIIGNYISMNGCKTMTYTYDFGDNWQHTIHLEKMIKADPKVTYPRCTGGKLKCPPEDCGGIYGYYQDFLPKVMDKNHPEHKEMMEWYEEYNGEDTFDPKEFDYKKIR